MSIELTPWFESTTKPSRVGVYLTRILHISGRATYQRWDGRRWGCFTWTAEDAALPSSASTQSAYQYVQWCGLSSDPAAQP